MKKILILLVMMLGLVGCGSEQSVDPTTIPTPMVEAEVTTTTPAPTEKVEPTTAPVPTEKVEPTIAPTETPVESEDEMKDYYVDPNTGEKVEITPTETPEPTPEVSEKITLYGEIVGVRINKGILTFDIHVACPHGDNGMCYAGNYLAYSVDVEANAENEKLYSKGSVVQVILDKIPGKCSAVTHFLTIGDVKVVK
jgi:hypothetical protein